MNDLVEREPDLREAPDTSVPEDGCIDVEETWNLGAASLLAPSERSLVVRNCSELGALEIRSLMACEGGGNACAPSDVFSELALDGDASGPWTISPGGEATLTVTFAPSEEREYEGEIALESNAADSPKRISVVGTGTSANCPLAIASAKVAENTQWDTTIATIPLKTIEFDGSESMAVDGTIDRFEWNIVQRPTNSTAAMTPSATIAAPSLFLDLAGEYVIELKVYDNGVESCGDPAVVRVTATPDTDIHVQLVWDTPTDSDQTDANGTDVDLHFLHPNGVWNNAPWDIYWLNPTAEWGVAGPTDDPRLEIDDSDGAGPENVTMQEPGNLMYAVGVYYYADNGFGPTYATIRVFVRGIQAYEYRDMFLPTTGTFWYAATITWPTGAVAGINNVQQGFPNLGN